MIEVPRFLLVDDDATDRRHLRRLLEQAAPSARILDVASGEAALESLAAERFDLVLSDYRLGAVDGITLLEVARRDHPATARILVTGHADVDIAREAINRAGVHAFLQKPVAGPALFAAVKTAGARAAYDASSR